jgi:predicted RNase H-like nuclease (RuvC/YqgF family)
MTIGNWSDDRDNTDVVERQQKEIKKLQAELDKFKKAYKILVCYFDSISDEEQPKINKKLEKLGL